MPEYAYNRDAAVQYAHAWAFRRNPSYYNFEKLGGDCTNFASQCIFAGAGVMNWIKSYGWYYTDSNNRSPSWAGVPFLYTFLTNNRGPGPYAVQAAMAGVAPGDFVQLGHGDGRFFHSPFIVSVGSPATKQNILIATHTYDRDYYPLAAYDGQYELIRFVHILGVRA